MAIMRTSPAALAGLQILVVEDEAMIAMMLEQMLEDLGCRVVLASSVETALHTVRGETFHGVLLDMNMHGHTTLAVAEELAGRSVPFLLVTGYGPGAADPPVIQAAPRLLKPFTEDDLARRMTELFAPS